VFTAVGVPIIKTPVQAPRANAIPERWVGSARRECPDRMLITGERHLRLVLGEYAGHYNSHRPHRSLQQSPPAERPYPPALGTNVQVLRRDRLGGLIHEYAQVAYGGGVSAPTRQELEISLSVSEGEHSFGSASVSSAKTCHIQLHSTQFVRRQLVAAS
jgi:Integrase core domain